ncbi:hypothetical protein BJV78DRAFT_1296867 [Lactifluus subvellereus]|nr:hypothetical protein BJV78DRAFT_1296867 [Lactifluus subvellereus]
MSASDGVHGTVCNAEQYNQSFPSNPNPSISCLTHGQAIGLTLAAEASFLSLISIIVVFILVGVCLTLFLAPIYSLTDVTQRNVLRYRRVLPNGNWKLLHFPPDIYMLSLFIFDILQALGGILDVRWAHNGIVAAGPYCSAQGIIQQFGELGVALITLIMAIHTAVSALWGVGREARMLAFGIVGLVWVFTALWVGIGNGVHKNYEAPTPFWCWISPRYGSERLAGEYLWLWFALFASVIMYIPLYFWAKGRLSVGEGKWYKLRLRTPDTKVESREKRDAVRLLFLPLAYSLVVLPLSVARWSLFDHKKVSSAATFFGVSMFNLSGAINVLLLLLVRPRILLFIPPVKPVETMMELGRPSTAGSLGAAKYNLSLQPTAKGLEYDLGERSWRPTSRRSTELSPTSSTARADDI